MRIPARLISNHIAPQQASVSVRTESGAPCFIADIAQLEALIAANTIVGVLRGQRLKYVELLVPPDVAFRDLGESRDNSSDSRGGGQWKYTYRETEAVATITILKRYYRGSFVKWSDEALFPSRRFNPDLLPELHRHEKLCVPVSRQAE